MGEEQTCTDSHGTDPHVEVYDSEKHAAALYSTKWCEVKMEVWIKKGQFSGGQRADSRFHCRGVQTGASVC